MTIRVIAALFTLFAHVTLRGDEGMWRFDQLPLDTIAQKYGVRLTAKDVERLQHAPVRIRSGGGGGTGTFASANGLILTNHHVALDCIRTSTLAEQSKGRADNLIEQGFTAKTIGDELACRRFRVQIERSARDVTAELNAEVTTGDAHRGGPARAAAEAVGSRARLQGGERHHLLVRGHRFQQRRLVSADRLRGLQRHPPGLCAREAARLLRRRRDELPLPAIRLRHLHPARVRREGRLARRVRRRARAVSSRTLPARVYRWRPGRRFHHRVREPGQHEPLPHQQLGRLQRE